MERVILKKLFQKYSNIIIYDLRTYGAFLLPLPLFLYLSATNFVSHSEFWAISSATLLGSTLHEAMVLNLKPVFYLFLQIPYYFNLQSPAHVVFARMQFGLLAFINLILIYRLIRTLNWSRLCAAFYCGFLLTFHVYFYNFYRVRADFITLFFLLLILERLVRPRVHLIQKFGFDPFVPVLVFLLSLSTPKAVYSILWICCAYAFLNWHKLKVWKIFRQLLFYFLLPASALVLGRQILGIGSDFIENIYALAINYHFNSLENIWEAENFSAVVRSLRINFLQYFVILVGILLFFLKRRFKSKERKLALLLFCLSGVTLLIHPERWDFFIASLIPFLGLPGIFVFESIGKNWQKITLVVALIWTPLHMTYYTGWWFSNQGQLKNVEQVEFIMEHFPGALLFDATGVAPRVDNLLWFLGPYDVPGNRKTLKVVEQIRPEVILFTPKLRFGGPELIIILNKHYNEVRPNLWVSNKFAPEFSEVHFPNWNYNLGAAFNYDHLPRIRSFSFDTK